MAILNSSPSYQSTLFNWTMPANNLGSFVLTPTQNGGLIDVFNTFDWTLTPQAGRQHIPRIVLTEFKMTQSSELRGYLYSARGKISDLATAANIGSTLISNALQNTSGNLTQTPVSNIPQTTGSAVDQSNSSGIAANTNNTNGQQTTDPQGGLAGFLQNAMDPYYGLYAVAATNFSYVLPYYTEKSMVDINNNWDDAGTDGLQSLGNAAGGIGEIADSFGSKAKAPTPSTPGAATPFNPMQLLKGAYTAVTQGAKAITQLGSTAAYTAEKTKAFKAGNAVDQVTIDFYLYNTFDHGAGTPTFQKNWDLCYLLTYQNLPNRISINLLDSPVLYSVDVPGYKHIPLAYMSSINITNVGNVRLINITTGEIVSDGSTGPNVKMLPEAYHITFTLESVLHNTRNLFLYNADPGKGISVTVT